MAHFNQTFCTYLAKKKKKIDGVGERVNTIGNFSLAVQEVKVKNKACGISLNMASMLKRNAMSLFHPEVGEEA